VAEFEKSFTLMVPSSTENLALIRDFVSAIGAQAGFDEKCCASRWPSTRLAPT